jgi:HD-GYP domain-containing protein (c-di-GMP phosphodiesterase class II)
MNTTVFLLTNNMENETIVRSSLEEDFEILRVTKSNLMVEMYKIMPQVLIVDVDSFGEQIIDMVQSIISIEYLPVIYIYSDNNKLYKLLTNEVQLSIDKIGNCLLYLIKQAIGFKNRYDNLEESYNAIDLLNGSIKNLLKKYIGTEDKRCNLIIKELINSIYAQNLFLTNKPRELWVFSKESEIQFASLFQLDSNLYKEKTCFQLQSNDAFKFDVFANNGFSKNFNVNELSDISFNEGIFPESIMKYTTVINNFAGFAIGDFIFIGMNYQNNVTNYDINIMKALTIGFDLTETIKHQVNEIEEAFVYTTDALARAAEANDDVTGYHIKRVNFLASRLARELNMSEEFISKIENAAQMHDVGKIYIDKTILTKPGKLTAEEFEHIKNHTVYGEKIIGKSGYLKMSSEIARSHHERFDGSGYPDGMKGEEIPISARIVFLADIYDALRSDIPYKPGFSHTVSYDIITKGDGRVNPEHFDPIILHTFKKIHLEFEKIYNDLKD